MRESKGHAHIDSRWPSAGVVVLVLSGEFDLAIAGELARSFEEVLPNCSRLVVDANELSFIDSSTLRVLVEAAKAADGAEVDFAFVLPEGSFVERTIELVGVMDTLHRVRALDEALPHGETKNADVDIARRRREE